VVPGFLAAAFIVRLTFDLVAARFVELLDERFDELLDERFAEACAVRLAFEPLRAFEAEPPDFLLPFFVAIRFPSF
jgi:hypothetical protein